MPELPETDPRRVAIRDVARGLRELHRALLDYAQAGYERTHGPVGGPGRLLHLVMHDPAFGWLHAMSELMVDIDELLDGELLTETDAAAVRSEVEELISPPSGATDFSRRYVAALQEDTDLVLTHARVRHLLGQLPTTEPAKIEEVRQARPQWSVRRMRRKPGPVN